MSPVVLVLLIIVAFVIILRWMLSDLNRYYVELDDDNLCLAVVQKVRLPFNEIRAIIIGLPDKMTSGVELNKYLNHSLWQVALAERRRVLLIVNDDRFIMQMNIHWDKNGTELMLMFADLNDKRVIVNHVYTDEQTEVLKRPRWNRTYQNNEIESAFRDVTAS